MRGCFPDRFLDLPRGRPIDGLERLIREFARYRQRSSAAPGPFRTVVHWSLLSGALHMSQNEIDINVFK